MTDAFKVFEKYIDNDLDKLTSYLLSLYKHMENTFPINDNDVFVESGSISTIKWRYYNVFQFNNSEIYNIYAALRELAFEAFEYYAIDHRREKYMIQGWFNVNRNETGKLDWHRHVSDDQDTSKMFHGYYGVQINDSSTYYDVDGDIFENKNENNRLILANSRYPHAMGDWDWDGPRISVAYDILPLSVILEQDLEHQHWFPLGVN